MKVRNLALAAAFTIGLANMAGAAMAQTKIFIVNETKIYSDSKIGKALVAQLKELETTGVDKLGLKTLQTEVQSEGAALQPQTQSLSKEALAANPTLKGRVDAYNKKYSELMQKSNALEGRMDQQAQANQIAFNFVLGPAVDTVAKEVGADVVLSYGSALYNKDSIDISAKVVARLDATVPSIEALKAILPKPPAQPAQASAAPKPPGGGQ